MLRSVLPSNPWTLVAPLQGAAWVAPFPGAARTCPWLPSYATPWPVPRTRPDLVSRLIAAVPFELHSNVSLIDATIFSTSRRVL